jgi:hypothetical protein
MPNHVSHSITRSRSRRSRSSGHRRLWLMNQLLTCVMLIPVACGTLAMRLILALWKQHSLSRTWLSGLHSDMDWRCSVYLISTLFMYATANATYFIKPSLHDLGTLLRQIASLSRLTVLVLVLTRHEIRRLGIMERHMSHVGVR